MAHKTEAECLLETGVLYHRRFLLYPATGEPIFAGFKPGAFSLYFGDAPIYHFDREGRWQRAFVDGLHVLKGLDTSVQAIDRVREGENLVLKRRTLGYDEANGFDDQVRTTARELLDTFNAGHYKTVEPSSRGQPIAGGVLCEFLKMIVSWDVSAWLIYREKYLETYGPLPFLPPDCPSPVVLQATLGHENGRTFGAAAPSEHRVRTSVEFEHHALAVASLLGRRADQCKTVFLGGSDVLRHSAADLEAYLETISRVFPIEPTTRHRHPGPFEETRARLDGIHAFLDDFASPLPGLADWRRFQKLGLVRVSLGVESGCPEVRSLYGKHWANGDLIELAAVLKDAGIGVSPIVLIGAGGSENEKRHVSETLDLINALELGLGDVVALVDAAEVRASGLGEPIEPLAFTPISVSHRDAQRDVLKTRLEPVRTRKAKVVPYSLEKQGAG